MGAGTVALALVLIAGPARAQQEPEPDIRGSVGPNQELFGDQIIDRDQLAVPRAPVPGRLTTQAVAGFAQYHVGRWPGGVIPIRFQNNRRLARPIADHEKAWFFEACAEWTARARVRCVPWTNQKAYVYVMRGDGCNSAIGYKNELRRMSLGDGCWSKGVIIHELGHAFGLLHEHQRWDRDRYIIVNYAAVQPDKMGAYVPLSRGTTVTPYDFESVMHYGDGFFAIPNAGPTFTLRPQYASYAPRVGLQLGVSRLDGRGLAAFYGGVPQPPPPDGPRDPEEPRQPEPEEPGREVADD